MGGSPGDYGVGGYGRWTRENRARFGSSNGCEAVEMEENYATMRNT